MRQALVESIVLTVAGIALGFAVAVVTVPLLLHYLPALLATQIQPSFRGPVLLFVTGIAVVCSLLCGLVPAWQRTQPGWFNALQEGGRSGTGGLVHQRTRSSLVVAQIALSLLLLAGAGLLLEQPQGAGAGRDRLPAQRVALRALSLPQSVYGPVAAANPSPVRKKLPSNRLPRKMPAMPRSRHFTASLQDRLHSIPGVSSAAIADAVPFDNQGGSASFFIKGRHARAQ